MKFSKPYYSLLFRRYNYLSLVLYRTQVKYQLVLLGFGRTGLQTHSGNEPNQMLQPLISLRELDYDNLLI